MADMMTLRADYDRAGAAWIGALRQPMPGRTAAGWRALRELADCWLAIEEAARDAQ